MKIFLTGGTGFIGSHFINQAHEAGHEIVAHRRAPESRSRIPLCREPQWLDKSIDSLAPADFTGCEVLVHLAAHSANVPYDTLENCIRQNVLAPLAMFRAASGAGLKRFVVAGSCFEYGRSGERHEFIPPDAGLEPVSSYPASKAAASVAFHSLACEEKLELLILRIFQVFGEGELETRFWPSLRKAALAGEDFPMSPGLQVRDFINVTEVAAGFVKALERKDLRPGEPVIENLGSGNPRSLIEFAKAEWHNLGATGKLLPGAVPMRANEVMRFVPVV
ncbi:CDP-abequose synthase [Oceaniferula spumae]|uniref:CDP-abequose synthase n=1 Tax=Oceaniferula spumae TaxID=2979115 RepID=A0AAT9FLB5_9BACT